VRKRNKGTEKKKRALSQKNAVSTNRSNPSPSPSLSFFGTETPTSVHLAAAVKDGKVYQHALFFFLGYSLIHPHLAERWETAEA